MHFDNTEPFGDCVEAMVNDVIITNEVNVNEQPNVEAQAFYDILQATQRPLWDGCSNQTELSNVVRLMSIKSNYNMPENSFNEVIQVTYDSYPTDNRIPKNYSELKKKAQSLGLDVKPLIVVVACCILKRIQHLKNISFVIHQNGRQRSQAIIGRS